MLSSTRTQGLRTVPIVLLSAFLLVACGSTTDIVKPSTYVGEIAEAPLENVYLVTHDDKRLSFMEVFEGFEAQSGLLTDALPIQKIAVADITYEAAAPAAAYYDANANNNGYLEAPELLVLYIRESAIGLGHSVDYLGVNPRVNALATSTSDTGGLMRFVKHNKTRMTDDAQKIIRDFDRLGQDRRSRSRGSGGGGAGGGR